MPGVIRRGLEVERAPQAVPVLGAGGREYHAQVFLQRFMADTNDGCAVCPWMPQARQDRDLALQRTELEGQYLAHDVDAMRLNPTQFNEYVRKSRNLPGAWRMHDSGAGQ